MVYSHPQWLRTRELARSGAIGELRAIIGAFSYFNNDPITSATWPVSAVEA